MKIQFKIFFLTISLLPASFFYCGNSILAPKENYLKRPLGVSLTAIKDKKFELSFYIVNEEEIFNGYNIYASKTSISDADFVNNDFIEIILPEGEAPSYAYNNKQVDTQNTETKTLKFFDGNRIRFEPCQEYFFRLRAYGDGGILSRASNEVNGQAFEENENECD